MLHNIIDVWLANLNVEEKLYKKFYKTLSEEERKRASRFLKDQDRHYFVVARGLLRELSGQYCRCSASEIKISYHPLGKPYLLNNTAIQFNLSHAGDKVLFAFSKQVIGVDLEYKQRKISIEEIAKRFFSKVEYCELMSLPPEQQSDGFFKVWTCKEAFIKAQGSGIYYGLNQFDVNVNPKKPAALLAVQGDTQAIDKWSIIELPLPHEDYVAALAVNSKQFHLQGRIINYDGSHSQDWSL